MDLPERIVRRFLAEAIADPKMELEKFRERIKLFSEHEEAVRKDLPLLHMWMDARNKQESPPDGLAEKLKDDRSRYTIRMDMQRGYWFMNNQPGCRRLFWAILQQYRVPPNLQKAIEAASKFWSKKSVRAPKPESTWNVYSQDLTNIEAYLKVLDVLRKQLLNAEAAIAKGQAHADPAVAALTKTHVGPFDVVNTGGFDEATMKLAVEIVEKAEKALSGHGLGKVCYGDILISKQISNRSNVLAFYIGASDEMFIRADARASEATVLTVCHELAHRFQHKFLENKRGDINHLYFALLHSGEDDSPPQPHIGDPVPYHGKVLKVTGYGGRGSIQMKDPDDPNPNRYMSAPVETVAALMGWKPAKKELDFITPYAKRGGAGENFAEMVSYYCLGRLPKPQVELLEPVLFA
jgi:hypothetical protein